MACKSFLSYGKLYCSIFPVVLAFLLSCRESYGQINYRPGYIISASNDTVFGKIPARSNSSNYKSCMFKSDGSITEYMPDEIKGFGYKERKYFISGILPDTFVEFLVSGPLRLFYYNSFYVQKEDSSVVELSKKEIKVSRNGNNYVVQDNRWRGILGQMVSDIPRIRKEVDYIALDRESLIKFVKDYNSEKGSDYFVFGESTQKFKVSYGILPALGISSLTVRSGRYYVGRSGLSPDFSVGFRISVPLPRLSHRLQILGEAKYMQSNYTCSLLNDKEPPGETYYDTSTGIKMSSILGGLKYTLVKSKLPVYLSAGASYNINSGSSSQTIKETVDNNLVLTDISSDFKIRDNRAGWWCGIELERNIKSSIVGARLSYEHISRMNISEELNAHLDRVSITILLMRQ